MNTIIQAENLCKTFSGGGRQQHVLKNLNLEIYKEDFTVVMGNSGSGKSTLLYALSGMDKPTIGKLHFSGEQIDGFSNDKLAVFRRAHCGFVFQDIMLNENMSILDNILAAGFLLKGKRPEKIKRAKELLTEVGIEQSMFGKFPRQMSGGELQRVALVRALINDPEVIFADEPTGALNSANSENVLNLFNQFHEQGKAVLVVTHDLKTASHGTRVLYLKDGQILNELSMERYTPQEERARIDKLKVFLDEMGW